VTAAERGHREWSHTADVILEAWGPDLVSCCEEACAALVATFAAIDDAVPVVSEHSVHLSAGSPESLLLAVLEEVIFVLDTADAVPIGATVRPAPDGGLDVVLSMAERAAVEGTGAVPKAVSRSALRVDEAPGRVRCRFLVDV
jgi:protein archease